ncbi:uncharacterized protein ELE39_001343 [Cryptosporidium sp. chipmunk genotype I]|uniref:uncharacterized protein n=1 Tax=Cryptosporidium sp. chipmunk genotype I TaxID=1280935 RepID=UPI00351A99E7|nr:hypothetical protein ELE39_001343 [Cryptosporidium sp. chipmunk genotype I]
MNLRFWVFINLFLGVFSQDQMLLGNTRLPGNLQERIFSSFPGIFNRLDNKNSNSTEELQVTPTKPAETSQFKENKDEAQKEELRKDELKKEEPEKEESIKETEKNSGKSETGVQGERGNGERKSCVKSPESNQKQLN